MTIIVRCGILYKYDKGRTMLSEYKAKEIAEANGFYTVAEFADKYDGQKLHLSIKLKIKEIN